jgi:hypothetical protein
VIKLGDKIYLDGNTGEIRTQQSLNGNSGNSIIFGQSYFAGFRNDPKKMSNLTFGFFLDESQAAVGYHAGDVVVGDPIHGDHGLRWDDANRKLYIKGDVVLSGDIMSDNYVAGVSGWDINIDTGSAEFNDVIARGNIYATGGTIAGWTITSSKLYARSPDAPTSPHIKIELTTHTGGGDYPHFQVARFPNEAETISEAYDAVTITTGGPDGIGDSTPRVIIHNAGIRRMQLDRLGLHFYDPIGNETHIISGTSGSNGAQTSFGDSVKINDKGIVMATGKALSCSDGAGRFFQMYVDNVTKDGVVSMPNTDVIRIQSDLGSDQVVFYGPKTAGTTSTGYVQFMSLLRLNPYTAALSANIETKAGLALDGSMYYNQDTQTIRFNKGGGISNWTDLGTGGSSSMPSGSAYQTIMCLGGTTWAATSALYLGSFDMIIYPSGSTIVSSKEFSASGSLHTTGNVYTGGYGNDNGVVLCKQVYSSRNLSVQTTSSLSIAGNTIAIASSNFIWLTSSTYSKIESGTLITLSAATVINLLSTSDINIQSNSGSIYVLGNSSVSLTSANGGVDITTRTSINLICGQAGNIELKFAPASGAGGWVNVRPNKDMSIYIPSGYVVNIYYNAVNTFKFSDHISVYYSGAWREIYPVQGAFNAGAWYLRTL